MAINQITVTAVAAAMMAHAQVGSPSAPDAGSGKESSRGRGNAPLRLPAETVILTAQYTYSKLSSLKDSLPPQQRTL